MRHHLYNLSAGLQRGAGLVVVITGLLISSCSDDTAVQPTPIEDTDGADDSTDGTSATDSTVSTDQPDVADVDGSDQSDDVDGSDATDEPDVPDVDGSDDATDGSRRLTMSWTTCRMCRVISATRRVHRCNGLLVEGDCECQDGYPGVAGYVYPNPQATHCISVFACETGVALRPGQSLEGYTPSG